MRTIETTVGSGQRDERTPDERWLDQPFDEVHDAALDSFPASDPPSWSPIRIGAPVKRGSPARE